MNTERVNSRLNIALNRVSAAHYDPRPAVVNFLSAKEDMAVNLTPRFTLRGISSRNS